MDSKVVNAHIKRRIWPRLNEAGFGVFTARTAWRHHEERIDVLNFQSFNSYNAEVIGCTTYSFSVNLGCFLKVIPPQFEPHRIKSKAGQMLPQEFDCHFRGRMSRTFNQPELKHRGIWYIDPGEKYLGWAMTDVETLLSGTALPWFDSFADGTFALQVLLNADEVMEELWGFGRNPSPVRHYFTGYVALGAKQNEVANQHLSLALASGCFKSIEPRLQTDIQRTNESMHVSSEDARA